MRKSLMASAARSVPSRADYRGPESGCGPNSSVEGWLPRDSTWGRPATGEARDSPAAPCRADRQGRDRVLGESGQTGHNIGIGVLASHHPRLQRTVFSDSVPSRRPWSSPRVLLPTDWVCSSRGKTPPASPSTAASVEPPNPPMVAPVISRIQSNPPDQSKVAIAKSVAVSLPVPTITREKSGTPGRREIAIARPISGLTIDGQLDDWPKDLKPYPIRKQVLNQTGYDQAPRAGTGDPDAYFKVGYDRQVGLIYLAVVVRITRTPSIPPARKAQTPSYSRRTRWKFTWLSRYSVEKAS